MILTPEQGRELAQLSREIGRQIGLIVDRAGTVQFVLVGTDRQIVIPDLSDFRLGRKGLRGLRCIHTHLKDEPLNQDDLTDLALLRLDVMAALGVRPDGLPGTLYVAHVVPPNPEGEVTRQLPPTPFHRFQEDVAALVEALEEEMARTEAARVVEGGDRAVLVSVSTRPRALQMDSLEELADLARTAQVEVVGQVIQRPKEIHPRYLMGRGKIQELIIHAMQRGANLIIFDQDLTPAQVKAIGEITEMRVIDRTQLILDIFARHAHSRDGKVQVELAQLRYLLPRLVGTGTALSRLAGGIGGRGPGETKLEIDRRRIRDRIAHLERELEHLARAREQRRRRRQRSQIPIVSIVGYTNVGKSTLLNALTRSHVKAENLLFATLDTASRRLRFPREREVIITDTVGFIRELPRDLVAAFRATLEELHDAHLLLHVVDATHPHPEQQIQAVERILEDLDLGEKPRILVFNKLDCLPPEQGKTLCERFGAVGISALRPETLGPLLAAIEERLWGALESPTGPNPRAWEGAPGTTLDPHPVH